MSAVRKEVGTSHHVLIAMIFLAALLSLGISACSRPEPQPVDVKGEQAQLFQERSISRFGLRKSHKVALTFDDGPNPHTTPLILEVLKREGVRATFFIVGEHAKKHPHVLERIRADGHVLGNHSATHANLGYAAYVAEPELVVREIWETHVAIAPYIHGQRRPYFRAPYGAWNAVHASTLNSYAELSPYVGPILWTAGSQVRTDEEGKLLDAADWECWSAKYRLSVEQCADGYMNSITMFGGGVPLMHDSLKSSVTLAQVLIRRLKAAGYQFVTLDDLETLDQFQ